MEKISPNIDIKGGQEFITQQFLHFYTERGYAYLPSASLLPDNDRSVLFTGATITPLKKFIEQRVAGVSEKWFEGYPDLWEEYKKCQLQ